MGPPTRNGLDHRPGVRPTVRRALDDGRRDPRPRVHHGHRRRRSPGDHRGPRRGRGCGRPGTPSAAWQGERCGARATWLGQRRHPKVRGRSSPTPAECKLDAMVDEASCGYRGLRCSEEWTSMGQSRPNAFDVAGRDLKPMPPGSSRSQQGQRNLNSRPHARAEARGHEHWYDEND